MALRAVKVGESAPTPRKRKQTVAQAAASGSRRDLLVAMRERIAQTVSNMDCPPRDLSSLTLRLENIAKEIESIDLRAAEEDVSRGALVEDGQFDASAV